MIRAKTSLPLVVGAMLFVTAVFGVRELSQNPKEYTLEKTVALPPSLELHSAAQSSLDPVNIVVLNSSLQHPMLEHLSQEYMVQPNELGQIWNLVVQETQPYSIDPFLMMAIIQEESSYQRMARSRVGALGLTQVMPNVHRARLRSGENLTDPTVSIRVGTQVLHEYILLEKGNIPRALQRYNGSLKDSRQRYARHILAEKHKLEALHIQFLNSTVAAHTPHVSSQNVKA